MELGHGVGGHGDGPDGHSFAAGVAKRVGKRNAIRVMLMLAVGAFVVVTGGFTPQLPGAANCWPAAAAFTSAGFWTLFASTMADVFDTDELETGQRREGSFSACQSWIFKLAIALGNGGSGWVLQFTGFDSKLPVQSLTHLRDPGAAVGHPGRGHPGGDLLHLTRAADRRGHARDAPPVGGAATRQWSERAGLVHARLGSCRQARHRRRDRL